MPKPKPLSQLINILIGNSFTQRNNLPTALISAGSASLRTLYYSYA